MEQTAYVDGLSGLRAEARGLPPTKALAHLAASLEWEHLDDGARENARRHLLDTLGAAIAGASQAATSVVLHSLERAGETQSTTERLIPGHAPTRIGLLNATHLMGTAAHGLELDDGFRPGMMHPGCVVVPATLLLAAQLGRSGQETLLALVAGYEIACRITAATHPQARWRGFHPTSTAGVFAAAVAAGKLLNLDRRRMENAMGIAASSSAGLFTFLDGGDVKRLHGGLGAREGLFAALLANDGLVGPPNSLESANGYFHSHAGGDLSANDYTDLDILAAGGPAEDFLVSHCYLKPYACCRHLHGPIEMLLRLRERHGFHARDIDAIQIGSYAVAVAHGEVGWSEMTTAQLSMPYAVAAALVRGKVTPAEFAAAERSNPEITELCSRISTTLDGECESRYPHLRPARMTVILKDGRTFIDAVDEPPGEPGRRLNDAAVEAKFGFLATPVIGEEAVNLVLRQARELEVCPDIVALLKLCAVH